MPVAVTLSVPFPIAVTVPILGIVGTIRPVGWLITNRRTRNDNAWWADWPTDINRRRVIRSRLPDDDSGQRRKRKADSDADVDAGLG